MNVDVIIIGAGASGLMCAINAAKAGNSVLIVEKNQRAGRKLLITGKGRCNLTNNTDLDGLISAVPNNARFLYSAFSAWSSQDTISFFEENGVPLKTERGNRVFPVSDKAMDIVDCLVSTAKRCGVATINGVVNTIVMDQSAVTGVTLTDGSHHTAGSVVIATGGLSYPLTGSSGDGYALAENAGHKINQPIPSLVPLHVHEGYCAALMGLSLKNITLELKHGQTSVYKEMGEMLFTHFGVSGPLVLSASAHIPNGLFKECTLVIDLKPALDQATLDARILKDFSSALNKNFINALNDLLPKKLVPIIVKLSHIKPTTKVNEITREQRLALVNLLKNLTLHITKPRPIDEAVITRGGVNLAEVSPKTLESKLVSGLHFIGEVLDVDAYTGGYNLQIAFSTAVLAARAINKKESAL